MSLYVVWSFLSVLFCWKCQGNVLEFVKTRFFWQLFSWCVKSHLRFNDRILRLKYLSSLFFCGWSSPSCVCRPRLLMGHLSGPSWWSVWWKYEDRDYGKTSKTRFSSPARSEIDPAEMEMRPDNTMNEEQKQQRWATKSLGGRRWG